MRKDYLSSALLAVLITALTFCIAVTSQAAGEFGAKAAGVAEGTGTVFSITDSDYLNVTLESSHEVMAVVSSAGGVIDANIIPVVESSVAITINGLEPSGGYYKYVDTFASGVAVSADLAGSLTFVQELGEGIHLFIKETPSTVYVGEEGWSNPAVGSWDPVTRTAVLNVDLADSLEVTSNDMIVDGNGHTVTGIINISSRRHVTVENFILVGGVSCTSAAYNIIRNNDISQGRGVHFFRSSSNLVEGNTFTNCSTGVFVSIYCSGNQVINNVFADNNHGMQYLAYTYTTSVTGNTFSGNSQGINVFGSDNNTFSENDFVNNGVGLFFECNPGGTGHKPDFNRIYNNNFLGNVVHAYICGQNNSLNLDMPEGGNHWSDWTWPDADADGIVDIPYEIRDSYSQYDPYYDNLPWTTPTGWMTNQAPEFGQLPPRELAEYDTLVFTLSVTDPDGDNIVALGADGLPEGAVFDNITGQFTWMPLGDQAGVYTITFSATDDGEPAMTGYLDVVITVGEVESPTDLTDTIIELIIGDEEMPEAVENSYSANLKKVNEFIESGKIKAAINQLEAFVHKTRQDVDHGVISVEDGDLYIMMAQDTINLLAGP